MNGNQLFWMNYIKLIILRQIGTNRYQKLIFEILLLSPPLENCVLTGNAVMSNMLFTRNGNHFLAGKCSSGSLSDNVTQKAT